MDKSEVYDLIDGEIAHLKEHQRYRGWNLWVIYAAIGYIVWMLINVISRNSVQYDLVIFGCLVIYTGLKPALKFYDDFKALFQSANEPNIIFKVFNREFSSFVALALYGLCFTYVFISPIGKIYSCFRPFFVFNQILIGVALIAVVVMRALELPLPNQRAANEAEPKGKNASLLL